MFGGDKHRLFFAGAFAGCCWRYALRDLLNLAKLFDGEVVNVQFVLLFNLGRFFVSGEAMSECYTRWLTARGI